MVDERQRDYVLTLPTLTAGQVFPDLQFKTDQDGPFCLREIGLYNAYVSLILKYEDNVRRFVQQDFAPQLAEIPYYGPVSLLTPVTPHLVYPPGAVISVYLNNTHPSESVTNGSVLFRGVSLHPYGTVMNRNTYPKYFREIPYSYVFPITIPANQNLFNIPLQAQADADFVFRGVCMGNGDYNNPVLVNAFQLQFKDQAGNYYEKQPVNYGSIASARTPHRPGVMVPEIYVGRKTLIYLDITNNNLAEDTDVVLRLVGSKVFPSQSPC